MDIHRYTRMRYHHVYIDSFCSSRQTINQVITPNTFNNAGVAELATTQGKPLLGTSTVVLQAYWMCKSVFRLSNCRVLENASVV